MFISRTLYGDLEVKLCATLIIKYCYKFGSKTLLSELEAAVVRHNSNSCWGSSSRVVHIWIGVVVDSLIVTISKVGQDCSVSRPSGTSSGLNEMTMAMRESVIVCNFRVVKSSKVMSKFMTKAVISKGTGLLGD